MKMEKVFICYRRSDSAGWTGRLYDRLATRLGAEAVYRDIDSIGPGIDFVEDIKKQIEICKILLVVIGPQWVEVSQPGISKRIEQKDDHVRKEIELALELNLKIIPVLVGDAKMPGYGELPPSIKPLANRNALQISDSRFDSDIDRLVRTIRGVKQQKVSKTKKRFGLIIGSVVCCVLGLLIAFFWFASNNGDGGRTEYPEVNTDVGSNLKPLGEENGIKVFCEGFLNGASIMLEELHYGGAVTPECTTAPNSIWTYNYQEAWCLGYSDGANQAARQIENEFLSSIELKKRYNSCIQRRLWD